MTSTVRVRHLLAIAISAAVISVGALTQTRAAREQQELLERAVVAQNRLVLATAPRPSPLAAAAPADEATAALLEAAARNQRMLVFGNLGYGALMLGMLGVLLFVLRPATRETEQVLYARNQEAHELRRAMRARSKLLARVSQQLRTPMNGVIGMAELLQAGELSRTQQEYARLIGLAARDLLGVVTDVLAWTRMESGGEPVYAVPVQIAELIELVVGAQAATAHAKGLGLQVHLSPDAPPRIITDEHLVSQVLTNLVTNAVRYTNSGQVSVLVEASAEELRFTVADTGPGMSPEQVVRALSRDHIGAIDAREDGAIGIGLMVSGHHAERLGGRLAIDSQLGVGSNITLHLPRIEPAATEGAPEDGFRGLRALVIAPLPLQRRYLKDTLEGWGMTVETEQDPLHALGRMREAGTGQAPLDLAFIAQDLPHMSGTELAVRTDMARGARPLRMILLANQTDDMPRQEALASGFSGLVPHPWKPRVLRKAAEGALRGQGLAVDEESRSIELTQQVQPIDTSGARVLIAEANPVNQVVLRAQLEHLGMRVTAVETGGAALHAAMERGHAAIFLDARLPGLDGLGTARQLRHRLGDLCPPIIILSSDDEIATEEMRDAGATEVLARPFTQAQLKARLTRSLHEETSGSILRTA